MGRPAQARSPLVPALVALAVMVLWGATPIITRVALDDLPALVVACMRTVVAGVVALPLLVGGRHPVPSDHRSRKLLAISAAAGFVIFPVLFTVGQARTSALHGVMILAVLPVFTGAYSSLVSRRAPRPLWLVGCAVAVVGEVVLIGGRTHAAGDATLAGDLIVLAAALCVSAGYVAGAMLPPRGLSSLGTTLWGVLLGTFVLAPLVTVLFAHDGVPHGSVEAWGAVVVLAVLTSIVGYVGWYWALDRGGIHRIATLQFFQPVSGFILAALVLGDEVTVPIGVGAVLVIGGVVIAQRA